MYRLVPAGVAALAAAAAILVACAQPGPAEHWTGGPVTPSPIQLTINPSAPPLGNTVPTGILVMNKEMILFFWGEVERPYLGTDWRDRDTGRITEEIPVPPVEMSLPIGTAGVDPIFGLQQLVVGDGTLVEYGAVRGPAARIVVRDPEGGEVEAAFTPWTRDPAVTIFWDPEGGEVEAAFTPWTRDPAVTIFWVHRRGAPIPKNVAVREGLWEPLAPDRYPLVSAYDGGGRRIADARIRPSAYEQKGG